MECRLKKSASLSSVLVLFLLVAANSPAQAPGDPTLSQGIKPYGSYTGSEIDVVSFENGKLDLHIPLLSFPQRGNLKASFTIRYNNPGYTLYKQCNPGNPPPPCTYNVGSNFTVPQLTWGASVVADFSALALIPAGIYNPSNGTYSGAGDYPVLYLPDGSSHPTGNISGTYNYRSTDASGWMVNSSAENFVPATVTDPNGIRYSISSNGLLASVEDTNGNEITATSSGWTDTLGRAIPAPPTSAGGVAGSTSNCPSGPLPVATAYAWKVPAPNGGTNTYTFCYVDLTVDVTVGGFYGTTPFKLTPVMLQSIVLPDGLSYSFTYDGAADLTQITLPTGGTIAYSLTIGQMCVLGGAFPQNYFTSVYERTVNANDGTGTHTWTYSGSFGVEGIAATRTVTDPLGNQEVHTLTGLNGTCHYYETEAQDYQGSSSNGTLLQTVTTTYSYNSDPYANPQPVYSASVVNVVPTNITTTWANGEAKLVTKQYDTGFTYSGSYTGLYGKVQSENDYDYGGSLLRTTTTAYAWQSGSPNYSSYLANNLINVAYSTQIKNGSGTQQAYTYYGYDESSLVSSGITEEKTTGESYPGNRTSVHRWESGTATATASCNVSVSNGYLVSKNVFYDTGEIQQSTDPCGNNTTLQYSSTYFGAYLTKSTNALNQSTTYAYGSRRNAHRPSFESRTFHQFQFLYDEQSGGSDTGPDGEPGPRKRRTRSDLKAG
jgi:YD repeat-containing protein